MESPSDKTDPLASSQRRAVNARGNVLVMAGAGTGKTKTLVERCLDCLARDGAAINELLIVTFTEAAAAEMRQRLRRAIESKAQESAGIFRSPPPTPSPRPSGKRAGERGHEFEQATKDLLSPALSSLGGGEGEKIAGCADASSASNDFWHEQLARFDLAHIGTLHGFCLKLIREHFYELGLDPQLAILDDGETRQRASETLDEQFTAHYEGEKEFSRAVQDLIQIHGGGRDEKIRLRPRSAC